MMKKSIIFLLLAWMSCLTVFGQEKARSMRKNDWWIGISAGVTHSLAENATSNDFIKNYPGGELQVGTFVNRALGFRLSLGLNPQKGRPGRAQREGDPETYDTHYNFNVLTGFGDMLIDLTTLFTPRRKYRPSFDVVAFLGGGGLESFHFDHEKVKDWEFYPVDCWDKTCWAAHAGLLVTYRISPSWDWMLEGSYTITDGRYDGVESRVATSGFVKLHTGFTYHFHQRQWNRPGSRYNNVNRVSLTTDENDAWEPSYTEKDRQRVAKQREEKLKRAQKENEKRRANRAKELKKRTKALEEAQQQMKKDKEQRAKNLKEKKLYNEI